MCLIQEKKKLNKNCINGRMENITKKELMDLNYVDKIYCYPKENKFEIMLRGRLFKTIFKRV